jgi:hypothetical protein
MSNHSVAVEAALVVQSTPKHLVLAHAVAVLMLLGVGSRTAAAQDVFPEVEYIAGHTGAVHKAKGSLVIGDSELKFTTKDGSLLFVIPISGVTEVGNQTDIRDASLGKKLLFGVFASSRKQEFVQVTYETEQLAEGIVFKVKQGISTGIVAKLKFAIKKIQGRSPTSQASASRSAVPLQN